MKKYTRLALIGAIVVGITGFVSLDAISAPSLMTMQGTSDMHETSLMIGHVTYEVRGMDGQIKHYLQSDNVITNLGKDCAAVAIFDSNNDELLCAKNGDFAYIAIGNLTGPAVAPTDTALRNEMDRSGLIEAGITSASISPPGTVVSITTVDPFRFEELRSGPAATTVTQSGLFDNDGSATSDNMFAIRDIAGGLPVTNTDTLSVTWTITLGSS